MNKYVLTVKNVIPDIDKVLYIIISLYSSKAYLIVKALKFAEEIVKGPYFVFQIELVARALALLAFALALTLDFFISLALVFALARSLG